MYFLRKFAVSVYVLFKWCIDSQDVLYIWNEEENCSCEDEYDYDRNGKALDGHKDEYGYRGNKN